MNPTHSCSTCDNSIPADAVFCPVCGRPSASPILEDTLLGVSRSSTGTATSYELAPERLRAALGPSYELGRLIGRGGYAEVFAVRDLRLKRELALKVLRPDLILTDTLVTRFRREAEAVGMLENTHIVPIYDVGESDGICWLLMPLVQGETLKTVLAREQRLPVAEAKRILLEAAEALGSAHEAGVVHRDIKPENLMIDGKTRRVLLMDFGIAKAMDSSVEGSLTGTGVVIGTPKYMSPEQAMGKNAPDPRSDQYSLAIVGYQMLTGRVPFEGENVREIITRQLLEEPTPLSRLVAGLPSAVSSTIHQALRKEPGQRFASMDAFAKSLRGEALSRAEGGAVRRESQFNIPAPTRRRPWLMLGAWLVVLGGAAYGASRAGLFTPVPDPVLGSPPESAPPPPETPRRSADAGRPGTPVVAARDTAAAAAVPAAVPTTCDAAFQAGNWAVAFPLCKAEAESNAVASRNLGLLYSEGHGVEQSDRLAAVHLAFAADSLDPVAAFEMARRYDAGHGVTMSQIKASRYYVLAANLGVPETYAMVARRYDEGNGLREDPKEAADWYRKAAEAGDVGSMTKLAAAYAKGRGVKKDESQATSWYSEAAKKQDPEAEYQVGMAILKGKGGYAKNEKDGLEWLRRAAAHGHEAAKAELAKQGG